MKASRRSFLAGALALPAVAADETQLNVTYRTLGRTGLKVSTLGFGCMLTSDASVVTRAIDAGVRYFDTARVYQRGNNERMLGAAVKGKRDRVVISSKSRTRSATGMLGDLEESLRALGTDYLDIWYIHDIRDPSGITDELLGAQQKAKKEGKVRFAGLSLHGGHKEVIPAAIGTGQIEVLLTTYNFAMDDAFTPLLASAFKAGLGVVAMKVMAGSFRLNEGYNYDRAQQVLKQRGAHLAALKWVLQHPFVHTAIPSIVDAEQLAENLRAMREPFDEPDRKLLQTQLGYIRPLYCRMCDACNGACPRGLPVADVLRYLTYAEGYGQFALGREHFLELPAAQQSVRCSQCPACVVKCPYGVKVAERLARAQELFA